MFEVLPDPDEVETQIEAENRAWRQGALIGVGIGMLGTVAAAGVWMVVFSWVAP